MTARIIRANIQSLSFQKGQCSKAVRWCSPTGRPTRRSSELGGIGDLVSAELKDRSAKYNKGKPIQTITSVSATWCAAAIPTRLIRSCHGYGNLALDLILHGSHGRLVVLKNGRYDNMPLEVVTSTRKRSTSRVL